MRRKVVFVLAALGVLAGGISAYLHGRPPSLPPPAFPPAANPYPKGIYANGILESYQSSGSNLNVFPEVPGVIARILVSEGQHVERGAPLIAIEDSVQRGLVEQQQAQLQAARSLLAELKAQPRPEALAVARAQAVAARAGAKTTRDAYDKQRRSFEIEPRSVSKDTLDGAENAWRVAEANQEVAERQLALVQAGAWVYDVRNQESQCAALSKALASSTALLDKFTLRAPADGTVLAVNVAPGSYVSPQGAYDSYTQGYLPVVVLGTPQDYLAVRAFVDEILVQRLPPTDALRATMFVRGSDTRIPLEFVRTQPYVTPKVQLSDQRQERVDVRVLPIIFRFRRPGALSLYPGQMVDVYIAEK